jgi:phosphoglycolate phosphatase-like HAD superfamily hydrolase
LSALLLFDVDGTLILSGGAGVRAMTRAFAQEFGVENGFDGIPVAGYTDRFLLSRALERAGLPDTAETHERFRERYLERLREEIARPSTGWSGVLPGVAALLEAITAGGRHHPALLTGNYEGGARIKLGHFGLAHYFAWGAFGDDSPDRSELARLAVQRARERAIPEAACTNVWVIGDTPHDITCARAIGARVVAVATGSYSMEQLRECGADVVLADLDDTAGVLRLL